MDSLLTCFPRLEPASSEDLEVVERQIRRPPAGRVLVAARCPRGTPAVILTVPFVPAGGPMPPLLWLSCPDAARKVSGLEAEGLISTYGGRLAADPIAMALFMRDEGGFAAAVLLAASKGGGGLPGRLCGRGVAGGRQGIVKCLHAHLAYRLAAGPGVPAPAGAQGRGLVGGWCIDELEKRSGVWCAKAPEACLGGPGDELDAPAGS